MIDSGISYDEHGHPRPDHWRAGLADTMNTTLGYTGHETDLESGLINMNARLFDPQIGRFISADIVIPDIYNPQSLNRYSYVLNNPFKYTDPSGHEYVTTQDYFSYFTNEYGDPHAVYDHTTGSYHFIDGSTIDKYGSHTEPTNHNMENTAEMWGNCIATECGHTQTPLAWELERIYPDTYVDSRLAESRPEPARPEPNLPYIPPQPDPPLASVISFLDIAEPMLENTWAAPVLMANPRNWGRSIADSLRTTAPSLEEQASAIKHLLNNDKNSVTIQTPNQKIHFDLDGPTHKGVTTPHKQYSNPNTNPNTGQTFWNKDSKTVDPLTQQDIRIIRNYLQRQNQ